jgi:multidrug efflux pump subunit AcrB
MVTSYLLSSTLVPVLSVWILRGHESSPALHTAPEGRFARFQQRYAALGRQMVRARWLVVGAYLLLTAGVIVWLGPRLGTEIFPKVDVGQIQLRLRAPAGTQIDGTEAIAVQALDIIKQEVGPQNVAITIGFLGVHGSPYPVNFIYLWNGGPEEGVLQVQLKPGTGIRIEDLKERLRKRFAEKLGNVAFSFEPSDIVSRVMSLGAPTPIEVAVSGQNLAADHAFAETVKARLARIPSLRDLQFGQALDYPTVDVNVDREQAGVMGVKMADVSRALVTATSSSRFVVPNYWADPNSGVAYQVQVQVPQARMDSLEQVKNIPVLNRGGEGLLLRNVAKVTYSTAVGQYERYNMQRMVTVTANISGADLGSVANQVSDALKELGKPPPGITVTVRGQGVPLAQMLDGLRSGLLLAVVVIFLLLAANFQSLKLSFLVVSTTPAAIAGVLLMLWLTGTTLNIQSFMGAIMAVGVAVANAILLVTFAERARMGQTSDTSTGLSAADAAVEGGRSRLRPILMTSLAMMAGMGPMAFGFGEGGQQTAPLGRAVVGGLAFATVATLLVLPSVFALVQARAHRRSASLDPDDPQRSQNSAESKA